MRYYDDGTNADYESGAAASEPAPAPAPAESGTDYSSPYWKAVEAQLYAWYRQYVGREPSADELSKHFNAISSSGDPASALAQMENTIKMMAPTGWGGAGTGQGRGDGDPVDTGQSTPPPEVPPPAPTGTGGSAAGTGTIQDIMAPATTTAPSGAAIDPSYLAPFEQPQPTPPTYTPFVPSSDTTIPAPMKYPAFSYPEFTDVYTAPEFVAPDAQTMLNDPSFLWRLNIGRDAIENAAAAKGVLNTGGTLEDIMNYGQGAASQEYQNIWNRGVDQWRAKTQAAKDQYDTRFNTWNTNRSGKLAEYGTNYGVATDAYGQAKDLANTMYARGWQQYAQNLQNATTAYNQQQDQWANTRDTFYKNQNNAYDKLYGLLNTGANAAGA